MTTYSWTTCDYSQTSEFPGNAKDTMVLDAELGDDGIWRVQKQEEDWFWRGGVDWGYGKDKTVFVLIASSV